jgi:coenzyme F420-reducing hydrogenase gamma subunit
MQWISLGKRAVGGGVQAILETEAERERSKRERNSMNDEMQKKKATIADVI